MKYSLTIEKTEEGFGAYFPDLPGCVAVGDSELEVVALIKEALHMHLEGLREDNMEIPPPISKGTHYIEAEDFKRHA